MNWLYLVVMAYIVLSALRGFHKGFLKVVYSIVSIFVAVVFVVLAAPQISHVIDGTNLSKQIESGCEDYVREQVIRQLDENNLTDLIPSWLKLPKKIEKELKKGSGAAAADLMEQQGIYKKAAKMMADFFVNLIAFVTAVLKP